MAAKIAPPRSLSDYLRYNCLEIQVEFGRLPNRRSPLISNVSKKLRGKLRRLESLEPRMLLAAQVSTAPAELGSALSAVSTPEGEWSSPLFDHMLALGLDAHKEIFGEPTVLGSVWITNNNPSVNIETAGWELIDPETTNFQIGDETDQLTQLGEEPLFAADEHHTYQMRGANLVVSGVSEKGEATVLSQLSLPGQHTQMFLRDDRLAVVSQVGSVPAITIIDVSSGTSPEIVNTIHLESRLEHAQLNGRQITVVIQGNRSLVPGIQTKTVNGETRWETQEEFTERLRSKFAEIVNERLPYYRGYSGDRSIIRSGLVLDPNHITITKGLDKQLSAVVTVDILADEPGISSARGVTGGTVRSFEASDGVFVVLSTQCCGPNLFKFDVDSVYGQVELVARSDQDLLGGHTTNYFNERLQQASFYHDQDDSGNVRTRIQLTFVDQARARSSASSCSVAERCGYRSRL